jgi:FkbM family methyltransferase
MRRQVELLINRMARNLGIEIRRKSSIELLEHELEKMNLNVSKFEIIEKLQNVIVNDFHELYDLIVVSESQLGQDFFALDVNYMKKNGYFVEFGATNGIKLSNTYLLEKKFNWSGILVEPARMYIKELNQNRQATVVNKCVWSKGGVDLLFTEVGELSTVETFKSADLHAEARANGASYSVHTISLLELLITNNAPRVIDFLSIDTEGSEFEILHNFDFERYKFNAICVEHNFTNQRVDIFNLLNLNGYRRVLEENSKWDDWYVRS